MSNKLETDEKSEFEQAADEVDVGLVRDFLGFLKESKKWWLIPTLVAILIVGALVVLGGTGLAPFIYSLF